ncbi:methionine adenosyltransferase [Candidatus Bathyarchaeota archaeon]|nr:methionine adenosyltransferase [Candidatus Bathyarchaeota archaeon]MBS7627815.1 methionine adenosyltransferase [Candidatus Bathyarchaeota archaeon]
MPQIVLEELKRPTIEDQSFEIVERKGLGHPDYICDAVMESISVQLSAEYLRRLGTIAHHNIDKALLAAGEAEYRFCGGVIKKPMKLIIGDRATFEVEGVEIPVAEIAEKTAKEWFLKNLRLVDPEKHIQFQIELRRGSEALRDIFKRKGEVLGANDTSAAVGYAPMTEVERLTLECERYLNSREFKKKFPVSGEDIKVMALRQHRRVQLTISMAFIDQFVKSESDYFRQKDEILEVIKDFVANYNFEEVEVDLNTLDQRGRGIDGLYLTVLGTCADGADSGQVGRGNRVNGIIPLNRPISSEAAAGKNPVSHIGKIYNVLSHRIAARLIDEIEGIRETYVWLLSQIGKPINQPKIAAVQVILKDGVLLRDIESEIEETVASQLENIKGFCTDLASGIISVC